LGIFLISHLFSCECAALVFVYAKTPSLLRRGRINNQDKRYQDNLFSKEGLL